MWTVILFWLLIFAAVLLFWMAKYAYGRRQAVAASLEVMKQIQDRADERKHKYEQLLTTLSDQDFHVCKKCQRIVQGSCLDCLVLSK